MKNHLKQLQLETLDRHLALAHIPQRPSNGWIKAIRKSLSMSLMQLGKRLNITAQSASRLELNELDESITLKSLHKVAKSMGCDLVYAFIPQQGSLKKIIEQQAYKKAKEIILAVDHTMMLEKQAVGDVQHQISKTAKELAKHLSTKLWE